ncbi:hypothetical protein B0H16DRAFT_1006978 [Mycena metata]|uniref:Uncharacterized protein n=1 Tax=Mycena metata TaxID=1033252 RepID=A0AAD7NV36_9AGAR|nr:hypothetical protein B0H16DRAFT_1006978 [Mycena metata]
MCNAESFHLRISRQRPAVWKVPSSLVVRLLFFAFASAFPWLPLRRCIIFLTIPTAFLSRRFSPQQPQPLRALCPTRRTLHDRMARPPVCVWCSRLNLRARIFHCKRNQSPCAAAYHRPQRRVLHFTLWITHAVPIPKDGARSRSPSGQTQATARAASPSGASIGGTRPRVEDVIARAAAVRRRCVHRTFSAQTRSPVQHRDGL